MPPNQDLERADRAARAACKLARAPKLPDGYPVDAIREELVNRWDTTRGAYGEARALEVRGPRPDWGRPQKARPAHVIGRALADGAVELLVRAVELEADAKLAQERAIEAIRHASIGGAYPWSKIGELVGISAQAAFKRYRHLEDPEPQTTIERELEALEQ